MLSHWAIVRGHPLESMLQTWAERSTVYNARERYEIVMTLASDRKKKRVKEAKSRESTQRTTKSAGKQPSTPRLDKLMR